MLTGKVLDEDSKGPVRALRSLVRRMGEPVMRTAAGKSMKILGHPGARLAQRTRSTLLARYGRRHLPAQDG